VNDIAHGTTSGWNKCRTLPCGPCSDCKRERAEYQRTRRATKVPAYRSELEMKAARTRAWRRLAAAYPGEFRALVAEELQRQRGAA
jgi:SRSO17 transposase